MGMANIIKSTRDKIGMARSRGLGDHRCPLVRIDSRLTAYHHENSDLSDI